MQRTIENIFRENLNLSNLIQKSATFHCFVLHPVENTTHIKIKFHERKRFNKNKSNK